MQQRGGPVGPPRCACSLLVRLLRRLGLLDLRHLNNLGVVDRRVFVRTGVPAATAGAARATSAWSPVASSAWSAAASPTTAGAMVAGFTEALGEHPPELQRDLGVEEPGRTLTETGAKAGASAEVSLPTAESGTARAKARTTRAGATLATASATSDLADDELSQEGIGRHSAALGSAIDLVLRPFGQAK